MSIGTKRNQSVQLCLQIIHAEKFTDCDFLKGRDDFLPVSLDNTVLVAKKSLF